jgi:hypothetical protein
MATVIDRDPFVEPAPPPPPMPWSGWLRRKYGRWRRVCEAPSAAAAWRQLHNTYRPDARSVEFEMCVLRTGERPDGP